MPADPLLLTPGPLTTAAATREAATRDYGSRDPRFIALTASVRKDLAAMSGLGDDATCIPLQGSGTSAVEAMLGSLLPPNGTLAVVVNGAYGARIAAIARRHGRAVREIRCPETQLPDLAEIAVALDDPEVSALATVHSETTTGLVNPIDAIAERAVASGKPLFVDAMSSFGVLPVPTSATAVAASANKCLEGLPGVAFVLTRNATVAAAAGRSPSLTLDLNEQWARFERDGQWRFTPPTHVMAALAAALDGWRTEGGADARLARYQANRHLLLAGLRELGFETLLPDAICGPIIVTFLLPPELPFASFYDALYARGFAIYPGKLTEADTFRVGCIGQVYPSDMRRFVYAVGEVSGRLT